MIRPNAFRWTMTLLLAGGWAMKLLGDLAAGAPLAWPVSALTALILGAILAMCWRFEHLAALDRAPAPPAEYRSAMLIVGFGVFGVIAVFSLGKAIHYPEPWPQVARMLFPFVLGLAIVLIVLNTIQLRRGR